MSTLICWPKRRCCPPFCPPFEVVFRPQGNTKGYRGRQETGLFYWRFLFCSGKPEGKNGSGGERSNPLSYAGLSWEKKIAQSSERLPPCSFWHETRRYRPQEHRFLSRSRHTTAPWLRSTPRLSHQLAPVPAASYPTAPVTIGPLQVSDESHLALSLARYPENS